MARPFTDEATADIFNGVDSKKARKALPQELVRVARRKLVIVFSAPTVDSLRNPPGNGLEALSGDRAGQHSIRINDQYRICFTMTATGATNVEIVDYH
jgi:proteic killer suppression protein